MDKNKITKLLNALYSDTSSEFKEFDDSVEKLKSGLKQNIQAKTLEDVNRSLEKFRKSIDISSVVKAAEGVEASVVEKIEGISKLLSEELETFKNLSAQDKGEYEEKALVLSGNIQALQEELTSLRTQKDTDVKGISERLGKLSEFVGDADETFTEMSATLASLKEKDGELEENDLEMVSECMEEIEKVRRELNNRINNIPRGGNANRNIAVGGNTSVLSTFTDINLKPGSNVTITYSKNQTTKYTDITIAATGGAGTSRSISTVAVSSVVADTAATDIVVLASAGVQLTMPTAVGNTNLYTIKNVGVSSVLISTTGGQTIDTSSTLIMPVQFTSVDLISDNTNWNIT